VDSPARAALPGFGPSRSRHRPNDQARDDTDGDGVLEDTVGTRIRANTFDAQAGASGPAIWLEENVVGVPRSQCRGS
jgi:hypothetical protein